ncbi:chromosome segregation protein SMC [Leuconostoc lactis]|uniref:chromosome segregation protein SMC n=1 Tax=Leuconostoc lactis TaxID=1246 RepID=UPI0024326DE7|nr:chromosome segregation protein SMC [Leuconostoc lactis]
MKLKSLEISGFKSFADKTVIEFMPGMTGIVGPNGSGKSNIIEAIRWVMGEQSAKDLRGTKMADIIFGGTNTRPALNRAEVSMTFDNTDHYIKSDFSEIRITRKLYRSGESSYQINGVESRLRDIHELFMDTGLGRESFSIISQGRVESIFNAKPEDRRSIIEEVAGVYQYKQNKQRAQKELQQTTDNLARVADIIHEIEGRIEPLAEQSAQATDYIAQKARFDTLDRLRLALTQQALVEQKAQATAELTRQDAQVNHTKTTVDALNQTLAQKRQARVNEQKTRDALQATILQETQARERLIGAQNLSSQQLETLQGKIADQQVRAQEIAERVTDLDAQLQAVMAQQTALTQKRQALKRQLTAFDNQASATQQATLEADLEKNRHAYIQTMQTIAALHNALQHDDKTQQALQSRQQILQQRLQQEVAKHEELLAATAGDTPTTADDSDLTVLSIEVTKLKQQLAQATQSYQQTEKQWYAALNDLNKAKSQRDALHALDEYAGFYQGVRAVMQPAVRAKFPGIQGVVAELLAVPSDYTKAIETVLGGALQQIVVNTTDTAKQVIRYLTQKRAGRVTILPIDTIKPRRLTGIERIKEMPGFVGIAEDLVTMPAGMAGISGNLLGNTVVSATLDDATQIARAGQYRFRVVSLDGQVVNAGGSLTGGANQQRGATILSRQTELKQLTARVDELATQAQTLEQQLQAQRATGDQLREALQTAETAFATAKNETAKVDYELSRSQDAVKQQARVVQALQFELNELATQLAEGQTQATQNQTALAEATTAKTKQEAETARLNAELQAISQQSEASNAEKVAVQTAYATVQAQRDSVTSQVQLLQTQHEDLLQQQAAVAHTLADLQAQLQAAKDNSQNDAVIAATTARLATAQQTCDATTQRIALLSDEVVLLEEQLATQQETLRVQTGVQSQLAAQLARLETQLDNSQSQLLTQYETVDIVDIIGTHDVQELPAITEQLALVKRGLDEIGTVNLGAIEEYEAVKARFDFLTQQRDDLRQAKEILLQTIDEMDDEVRVRFKTTFDAIAARFSETFAQMFGGGQAEIRLTDPKHLLTTGIDIIAQPPGKKFQQMSLLSGGEKALTAMTLLFAILHVRPVPFVVFDEAEAALDEANVSRFAKYLLDFAGGTQFIVITHRKGTMMKANLLYGVTMQEAGVSKMIAVDLDKVTESVG